MTQDVFGADQTQDKPTTQDQGTGQGNALDVLVGEGKKYKTVDDLAAAYGNADTHIGTLTQELRELREDMGNKLNLQEMLTELKSLQIKPNQDQGDPQSPALDEGKIAELVKTTMTNMNTEGVRTANRTATSEYLTKELGSSDAATQLIAKRAGELGVSATFLQATAEQSPEAFYKLVGLAGPGTKDVNIRGPGDVSQQGVGTGDGGGPGDQGGALTETDWAFWTKLRHDDPRRYHSAAMHNRRVQLTKDGSLVLPKRNDR